LEKIFVDEIAMAKRILENGFINGNGGRNYWDLLCLGKYYKSLGMGEIRIKKALGDFCKSQIINSDEVDAFYDARYIKTVMPKIMSTDEWKPIPVQITLSELDAIRSIKNFRWQKVLFVMLVFAKELKYRAMSGMDEDVKRRFARFGYYVADRYMGEIKEIAKVKMSNKHIMDVVIFNLIKLGLTGGAEDNESHITPLYFVNDHDVPTLVIDDFEHILEYYVDWIGGTEIFHCADCGQECEKTGNKTQRCPSCAKKRKNEQNKLIMKKIRTDVVK
jgi:DNA-directed RNA polymerase subunit RPC12/RpoP